MDDILDGIINENNRDMGWEDKIIANLLGEVELIEDMGIHSFVRSVLAKAAPSFWVIPSSFSGKYHPPDERGVAGNVLHTKRVVRIVNYIATAQERSTYDHDILIAAAILHDITKGLEADDKVSYDPMHPYTVDKFINWVRKEDEKYSDETSSSSLWLDEETLQKILRLVRCHMGIWSPIPETIPVTNMDWTLHLADMIASKLHTIIDDEDDIKPWRWQPPEEK